MVDLFKYVGKRIRATYRSGDSLIGVLEFNEGAYHYPYWLRGSGYTQGGLWFWDAESQSDIVSVELLEETAMSNKVDLSKYVGRKIKVILRSGELREGLVEPNEDSSEWYPYTFWSDTYTKDGQWFDDVESMRDIISIVCEDDPSPSPSPSPSQPRPSTLRGLTTSLSVPSPPSKTLRITSS